MNPFSHNNKDELVNKAAEIIEQSLVENDEAEIKRLEKIIDELKASMADDWDKGMSGSTKYWRSGNQLKAAKKALNKLKKDKDAPAKDHAEKAKLSDDQIAKLQKEVDDARAIMRKEVERGMAGKSTYNSAENRAKKAKSALRVAGVAVKNPTDK